MEILEFRLCLMRDDTDNVLKPITRVAAHAALVVLKTYLKLMEQSDIYIGWLSVRHNHVL